MRPSSHLQRALAALPLLSSLAAGQLCPSPVNEPYHARLARSLAYGQSPALLDEIATLGPAAWVARQLDPASIDETGNQALADVLAGIVLPPSQGNPAARIEMVANYAVARALFSEKQLEARLTNFLRNHFTTSTFDVAAKIGSSSAAAWFQIQEYEDFRAKAFDTFGELLAASATGVSMLYYLDNYVNTAAGPNENYARELLELHTVGVDNGYTSQDVAELGAVFSGWTVGQVLPADAGDPTATPIDCEFLWFSYYQGDVDNDGEVDADDLAILQDAQSGAYNKRYDLCDWNNPNGCSTAPYCDPMTGNPTPQGDGVIDSHDVDVVLQNMGTVYWVRSFVFDPATHDYSPKVLFGNGPNPIPQLTLPVYPQGSPLAYQEGLAVLSHLAATTHCADFVCGKLFNYFVNDEDLATSDPGLLADLRATWTATGGDLGDVLDTLFQGTVLDGSYDMDYDKVRDGFERAIALTRALGGAPVGGATDAWVGIDRIRAWMDQRFAYALFRYPSPEGQAENGEEVGDTNSTLYAWRLFQQTWHLNSPNSPQLPEFDFAFDAQMLAAGVGLDDEAQVACYLLRRLLPGNASGADHALVVDFLSTTPDLTGNPFSLDYVGNPTAWHAAVGKAAGFAACLPQFLEQ